MSLSARILWLVLAAVVTMYIVLGVLYEHYVHPVTILSTLPSAGRPWNCWVRINPFDSGLTLEDLAAVVMPGLDGNRSGATAARHLVVH